DAIRAFAAIRRLASDPTGNLKLLNERLKPAQSPSLEVMQPLLKELESDSFKTRDAAMKKLEALGEVAAPSLRASLRKDPSPEMQRRVEALLKRLNPRERFNGEKLR